MNPACLSIQFKPLIRTIHQKSFCYLEIVPEISGLEHLDAVNWKDDELEYSIPMVYKVVLKRRPAKGNSHEAGSGTDPLKTYHSCVDLLNMTSALDVTRSQGDCSKTISDSFIFGKLLSDIQNFGMFLQKLDNNNSLTTLRYKYKSNLSLENTMRETLTTAQANVIQFYDIATEDNFIDYKPEVLRTVNNFDMTRLSVTPICSFNTNTLSEKQLNVSDSKHSYVMVLEHPMLSTSVQKPTDHGDDKSIKVIVKGYDSPKSEKSSKLRRKEKSNTSIFTTKQAIAQCRITQFRIQMKKEIMPLNEMLDQLIEKCVCLGIKKRSIESDEPAWKLGRTSSGSNRVVYTYYCV